VDFTLQIPELKTLAALLGCRVVAQSGVEADDLIASAAKALAAKGDDVRIASADKDFAQCVNERVHLLAPPPPGHGKDSWRELDAAGVRAKFGVPPEQIVDYLSLIGDSVDNIPGLPGVGPKTAVSWLAAHGSIEGILAARESVEPVRMREVLRGADAVLALNRKLITFASDFPGDWAAAAEMDIAGARAFFQRMEMRAVLGQLEQRLGVATGTGTPKPPVPLPQQLELF
jgi:DNA polymerase-1